MKPDEALKVATLLAAARRTVADLRRYIGDNDLSELNGMADYLDRAVQVFQRKPKPRKTIKK